MTASCFPAPVENSSTLDNFDVRRSGARSPGRAEMAGTRFPMICDIFFASQLIGQGETPARVRDQMGHSSIKVTFDTYGHLFPWAPVAWRLDVSRNR